MHSAPWGPPQIPPSTSPLSSFYSEALVDLVQLPKACGIGHLPVEIPVRFLLPSIFYLLLRLAYM